MKRLTYPLVAAALAATLTPIAASPAFAASTPDAGTGLRPCVSLQPASGFYEGGRVGTEVLTVPNSPCTTISVSHISDPANPADVCQTFLVGFYPPVDGSLTYTQPVTACDQRSTVLARNVPDGTRYIVIYQIDYLEQRIGFTVHN